VTKNSPEGEDSIRMEQRAVGVQVQEPHRNHGALMSVAGTRHTTTFDTRDMSCGAHAAHAVS
jgi:hypothetical protein